MRIASTWRRVRRHFSISAPRMAVRTQLGWPWRAASVIVLLGVVAAVGWWGFDFGQLLGGFNRREIEGRVAMLEADLASARSEAASLRARNAELESDLAMMRGAQARLQKQQSEVLHENAELKEELAFFRQFFADANTKLGVAIQRLDVDATSAELLRYSALVVRGRGQKDDRSEFDGRLTLTFELVPTGGDREGRTMTIPDDQPEIATPLKLRFKYYQRVDGTVRVPGGFTPKTVIARAYESGAAGPRATRTIILP
jgi:hypothetical protein